LNVNMGNIYFHQEKYDRAIKMYTMGLDKISNTYNMTRIKVMQNIALAFVKLKQYNDAIALYEQILQIEPDLRTALNLILCYFKVGDRCNMKYTFQRLLKVDLHLDNEDRYLPQSASLPDDYRSSPALNEDRKYESILEVIKNDELWWYEKDKKAHAESVIRRVAKIIAPVVELNFNHGYIWCIEQTMNSRYLELQNDLKIDKALMHLRQRDFHKAIETLKSFENKGSKIACTAGVNLSFLYFLEGDFVQADRYADIALAADRYSPAALVNKGNILFKQAQLERARDCYLEALQDDPTCVEALYNLGLAAKQMNRLEESLDAISKIHAILPANAQIIYQIMDIYERIGSFEQSHDSFIQLQGLVPSDAFLLQYCGESFERIGDKSQAFSYYYDSFKHYPCNIDVIEWLAAYYIESQLYEKSITFFKQAVLMRPNEIKWQLMIASCYRKSGNFQKAFEVYKKIHNKFPDSIECLQFLVRLQSDTDLPEADMYMDKLDKAIKLREAKEQRLLSASRRQSPSLSLVGGLNESRENISGGSFRSIRRSSTPFRASRISKTPSNSSLRSLQDCLESERECELRTPQGLSRRSISPYTSIVNYSDALGPTLDRPRTRTKNRNSVVNEFADDVANDDRIPE
uniref:TPR_REGION domain-containing protein n=1 Tax=Rodentolepis nana TaxID=102285 RepID=A0A0R3T9T1_RODNA